MSTPRKGYWLGGERLPSVTTVISNCKIGGIEPLLWWANNEGIEGRSHRETKNKAADAGTCAHDMIEAHIKGIDFDPNPYEYDALYAAKPCFNAFLEWRKQSKLDLVESEVSLMSERYKYGGTLDAMAMNGVLVLGDWKTSSHCYPDYLIQLAAYKQLWEENNPDKPIKGGAFLLRVGRPKHPDDPATFAHHYWSNLDMAWKAFLHMRELYDMSKRLKGLC